jgi:acetyl-CoA carboxylase biotin carboxylase subunit
MAGLKKVFVANRGEIAVRIVRACRDLGIETVQAYSEADANSLAVRLADAAVCVGPGPAQQSYLQQEVLVDAACRSGADAVHPGYGFLSENAEFAERVEAAGLAYVGTQPAVIRLMGDKAAARNLALDAGVPVIEGSRDPVADPHEAAAIARKVGFPVLIKAAAGGGGRGMRVVHEESQLLTSFERASAEAKASFGDGAVYIERFLSGVRHIEVQIIGDGRNVVHVGERDCTVQRRHQKLVEESPSPALTPKLRRSLTDSAVALASSVGYRGVGTIEYVVDAARQEYFFIEMNTRIQVEHPVTELVSGIDLVALQVRIASGEPLPFSQDDIRFVGHAIECRINAEDPERGFMPKPGRLVVFVPPAGPGVRMDTHAYEGYVLPSNYDSLIGKLVVWGENREEAIARTRRALREFYIEGIPTTVPFHQRLLVTPDFISGDIHTRYVKEVMYAGHPMQSML